MIAIDDLTHWFQKEKRDLPWRKNRTFYRVLVSEMMLQQTQAAVVIPYFERWMQQFPTLRALSSASEDEVIKAWEGLGYYKRARNLKKIAEQLAPLDEISQNLELPGVGPYTRGAIRAFAFRQRAAAVDGNVLRVISRLFLVRGCIDTARGRKSVEELVLAALPKRAPWIAMEALIELGALVCQKAPHCPRCPLKGSCHAFRNGVATEFPLKKTRPKRVLLKRRVTLLEYNDRLLVKKVKEGSVMAGLYEFPYYERGSEKTHFERLGIVAKKRGRLPEQKHTFTRYCATLMPVVYAVEKRADPPGYEWWPVSELPRLPFSSGHRKILGAYAHFTH